MEVPRGKQAFTLVSFISPLEFMREAAREKIGKDAFVEVYVKASVEACIKRDPKGMYKKAIESQIKLQEFQQRKSSIYHRATIRGSFHSPQAPRRSKNFQVQV